MIETLNLHESLMLLTELIFYPIRILLKKVKRKVKSG